MDLPEMKPVAKSSNVKAIGYNDANSALFVEFVSGGTYCYAGVPRDVWNDLEASYSKGSFIHSQIRNKYSVERLDTKP